MTVHDLRQALVTTAICVVNAETDEELGWYTKNSAACPQDDWAVESVVPTDHQPGISDGWKSFPLRLRVYAVKRQKEAEQAPSNLLVDGPWNNASCKGYVIHAMRHAGYNEEQIAGVLAELEQSFDLLTTREAQTYYYKGEI